MVLARAEFPLTAVNESRCTDGDSKITVPHGRPSTLTRLKAEVVSFVDLAAAGSMAPAKVQMEGKESTVTLWNSASACLGMTDGRIRPGDRRCVIRFRRVGALMCSRGAVTCLNLSTVSCLVSGLQQPIPSAGGCPV